MVNMLGWGTEFTLTVLEKGNLKIRDVAAFVMSDNPSPDDQAAVKTLVSEDDTLFIGYTAELEVQPGVGKRFEAAAGNAGYRKQLLETIYDHCGRASFEIYKFVQQ
jgi:hypothetical protein